MTSPCVREHVTEQRCVAAHRQMNDFETSGARILSKGHLRSDTKYLSEMDMSRQLCLAPKPKAQRLSPGYLCAFVPEA